MKRTEKEIDFLIENWDQWDVSGDAFQISDEDEDDEDRLPAAQTNEINFDLIQILNEGR